MVDKTYTIYHLVGIKVGCTCNLKKRHRENCKTRGLPLDHPCDILQVVNTAEEAERLEREWQAKMGYRVDNRLYTVSCNNAKSGLEKCWASAGPRGGKISGQLAKERGILASVLSGIGGRKSKEIRANPIIVTVVATGEETLYDSIKEAQHAMDIGTGTIYKMLADPTNTYKGYRCRYKGEKKKNKYVRKVGKVKTIP